MDALSEEKSMMLAALTTARVQLKEATPAGFAAEAAELRRQAEAAKQEAAAAKAAAAAAEGKVAAASRREAEVRPPVACGRQGCLGMRRLQLQAGGRAVRVGRWLDTR